MTPPLIAVANAPKVEFPILGGVYWGTPQTVDKAPGNIAGTPVTEPLRIFSPGLRWIAH